MRTYFGILLFLLILFQATAPSARAEQGSENEQYFIVTAYYSPLPDQAYYLTGDYTREKILNGQGISGASGKKVFSGMLAAPSNYAFGTKIYLEGLGVGVVEDRGGAIVNAGKRGYSYDRIDIWVGYGDEGLRRALYWGKRTVKGEILNTNQNTTLKTENIPAPSWVVSTIASQRTAQGRMFQYNTQILGDTPSKETKKPQASSSQEIFELRLKKGQNNQYTHTLNTILGELGYGDGVDMHNTFNKQTQEALIVFQIEQGVIITKNSPGAGLYGPKTRAKLKEVHGKYTQGKQEQAYLIDNLETYREIAKNEAIQKAQSIGRPKFGDTSEQVRTLQKTLSELGYFQKNTTAIFGPLTQSALIDFQIQHGVIPNKESVGAGIYGPKTQKALEEIFTLQVFEEKIKESEYQEALMKTLVELYQERQES